MAIQREIWLEVIKEGLTPDTSFLSASQDVSEHVDANKLNLSEAGIDPDCIMDNDVYPIGVESRTDAPKEILLHTFDTKNTVVRNVEEKETAYAKMESVTRGHKRSLIKNTSAFAAHAWSPAEHSEFNPVYASTGENNPRGLKALSFKDILNIEASFRALDVDMNSLVAVLNPVHLSDLMAEDMKMYKDMLKDGKIFSFRIYTYSNLPYYDVTTGKRKALATPVSDEHTQASIFYSELEAARAVGDIEVFAKYKDPEQRGDIIGFQERFTAAKFREKYFGAIYSAKAVIPTNDPLDAGAGE